MFFRRQMLITQNSFPYFTIRYSGSYVSSYYPMRSIPRMKSSSMSATNTLWSIRSRPSSTSTSASPNAAEVVPVTVRRITFSIRGLKADLMFFLIRKIMAQLSTVTRTFFHLRSPSSRDYQCCYVAAGLLKRPWKLCPACNFRIMAIVFCVIALTGSSSSSSICALRTLHWTQLAASISNTFSKASLVFDYFVSSYVFLTTSSHAAN